MSDKRVTISISAKNHAMLLSMKKKHGTPVNRLADDFIQAGAADFKLRNGAPIK